MRKRTSSKQAGNKKQNTENFGVTAGDLEARRQQRVGTQTILKSRRTPLTLIQVCEQADTVAAEAVAAAKTCEPPRKPAVCAEGCAWCCYKRVGVAVPEVVRITNYLRETLSPAEIDAVKERIRQALEIQRPRPQPCPLLVDNRCSVYPVRPLTCRGFNSSDADLCRASVQESSRTVVPIYAPQLRLTTLILDGLCAGLNEAGLRGDVLESSAALRIALSVPDAAAKWLQGEPIFVPARRS